MVILKFDTNGFCLLCFKDEDFMQGLKHQEEKLFLKIPERLSWKSLWTPWQKQEAWVEVLFWVKVFLILTS